MLKIIRINDSYPFESVAMTLDYFYHTNDIDSDPTGRTTCYRAMSERDLQVGRGTE